MCNGRKEKFQLMNRVKRVKIDEKNPKSPGKEIDMALTFDDIRHDPSVKALIEAGNEALGVLGFTDHGYAHAGLTARVAGDILQTLGYDERTCELARIAGYIHDVGNAVNRANHAMSGALLAFDVLRGLGMDIREVTAIITAIGNHDEKTAAAVTPLSAALILADKSDVRRSRVRAHLDSRDFDIHDRVNYSVTDCHLEFDEQRTSIRLILTVDTELGSVMEYLEIFMKRMLLCQKAAQALGLTFHLVINGQLLV